MSDYEVRKKAVEGLAGDLAKANPRDAKMVSGGATDKITSEQAHRMAAEVARQHDKKGKK